MKKPKSMAASTVTKGYFKTVKTKIGPKVTLVRSHVTKKPRKK